MAQVLAQARLLRTSTVSTGRTNRRSTICAVQKSARKSGDSKTFTSEDLKSTTTHDPEMYRNMTPLNDKKATNAPNLNVFEVTDSKTNQTMDNLFYQTPKEEEEHASCVKMPGLGLVCGSEEFLLHETHGCIHAGGKYYALPHDGVYVPPVDITNESYELLDGLDQATFDSFDSRDSFEE